MIDSNRLVLEEIFSIAPSISTDEMGPRAWKSGNHGTFPLDECAICLAPGGEFTFLATPADIDPSVLLSVADVGQVFTARFQQELTRSETRLLMQLIAGGHLPEISKQDGVSYDTRRNQLASIRHKAGRARQSEVIVIMAVLCANYLKKFDSRAAGIGSEIINLYSRYYQPDFRMHRPTMSSGRELTIVDVGPVGGRKLVFMHPVFFPIAPLPHEAGLLHENNIRVLTPVRPGHYGVPLKRANSARILDEFSDDFIEFLKVIGAESAPVVSHTYGIASAIAVAAKRRGETQGLLVTSPRFRSGTGDGFAAGSVVGSGGFSGAWMSMLINQRGMLEPVISTLAKPFVKSGIFIKGLEKAFRGHPEDLEILEFGKTQPWFHKALEMTTTRNLGGVMFDMDATRCCAVEQLSEISGPKLVWFSDGDPFVDQKSSIEELEMAGCVVKVFKNPSRNRFIYDMESLFEAALALGS
ncbi:MAG: hypothetical protein GXP03_10050 [Alphaproteobacteria bacterium]|nr:hypothetical protein [Alphaproteobacteria bacterium]